MKIYEIVQIQRWEYSDTDKIPIKAFTDKELALEWIQYYNDVVSNINKQADECEKCVTRYKFLQDDRPDCASNFNDECIHECESVSLELELIEKTIEENRPNNVSEYKHKSYSSRCDYIESHGMEFL